MQNKILLIGLMTLVMGCSEFIEPSISDRGIEVLAPANRLESNSYQQTFWWNPVADALYYRLQVVSPHFDSVARLVLDTLINKDKFTYTLDPGKYEWRVRAENGSSTGMYANRMLTIYPSTLSDQILQLSLPATGMAVSRPQVRFEWLKLFGAANYRLQVDRNNFQDEKNMDLNITTENLSFLHTLTAEGSYQFRVRAENPSQNSKWSTVRTIVFDTTGPEKPQLSTPLNKQAVTAPVRLVWNKISDAEKYEVWVYKSDGETPYSSAYPKSVTATEISFDGGNPGETVTWRVRGFDRAGNMGTFSEMRTFTVQ
ncbi:hypothetical protein ACS5PU_02180 [Pedobacter sp. GSP4]|uniref:hypothetical protein n=1 Tax=Pedobacter sp. GSP4 TaxID=3453716 RepID=UPI003EEC078B